jgi:hypothetical protein
MSSSTGFPGLVRTHIGRHDPARTGRGDFLARIGDNLAMARSALVAVLTTTAMLVAAGTASADFVQQAELAPQNAGTNQLLGYSVAANANTIVVGQVGDGVPGAVDIYEEPPGGWSAIGQPAAVLTDPSAESFGNSVAIDSSGDTIVVGADETGGVFDGVALVFQEPPGGWKSTPDPTAVLTGSDTGEFDFFGSSVAISADGSTIAIGAQSHKVGSNDDQGAAYVYVKPGATWLSRTQSAELTASGGVENQYLGLSVAISSDGSTVFAGAPDLSSSPLGLGTVYGFERPTTGWSATVHQSAKLTASDGQNGDQFGSSLALSGSLLVVGAQDRGPSDQGGAYVFTEPTGGWTTATQNAELSAGSPAMNHADIGTSVAIGPDATVVAGADGYSAPTSVGGSAYVFHAPASGWPASEGTTVVGPSEAFAPADGEAGDNFGQSAAFAGAELAIGAPDATVNGAKAQGRAYAFGYPEPTISIDAPANGGQYIAGTFLKASYACAVTGSTIASCTGTVANGAPVPIVLGNDTFTVTATTVDGISVTQTVHYTVVNPPRPVLSDLKQAHKRWRERSGTHFTFKLNFAANVTLTFRPRHGKAMKITAKGVAGRNRVAFFGVISHHHRLKPARYTVTFVASNLGGRSKPQSLTFTILPR